MNQHETLASAAPLPAKPSLKSEPTTRSSPTTHDGVTRATDTADEGAAPQTDRKSQIAVAAYYKAQHRGFTEGEEIKDWLAAEQEVDAHETNPSGALVKARY
jgi:hypothetical protein